MANFQKGDWVLVDRRYSYCLGKIWQPSWTIGHWDVEVVSEVPFAKYLELHPSSNLLLVGEIPREELAIYLAQMDVDSAHRLKELVKELVSGS